jgi:L-ascorbate metabolism protein UlaG (beta-lactamase superfamily)
VKKAVQSILYSLVALLLTLLVGGVAFLYLSPQFGAKPSGKRLERIIRSPNYHSDYFRNSVETSMDLGLSGYRKMIVEYFKDGVERRPGTPPPIEQVNADRYAFPPDESVTSLLWFGHSAFLVEIEGKRLLLDPMLGPSPAPSPYLGTHRYNDTLPLPIELLPAVDAVIFSHDHYDHLDYGSVMRLKGKVGHFFVPLGVGAHLEAWGVAAERITELDWWEEVEFKGLQLAATPARHFSGRGLSDRMKTLWASWVIRGKKDKLFFSGDSGYFDGFKEIGEKYGPFDLTMLECGQYNTLWSEIHMMPEQTLQAHLDLRGKVLFPIHWGAFTLAMHPWNEPIERVSNAAKAHSVEVVTPLIGEQIILHTPMPHRNWWRKDN